MKKILCYLLLAICFASCSLTITGCTSETQYDRDFRNGMDKYNRGDYSNMSSGEKQAVDNFKKWKAKQNN